MKETENAIIARCDIIQGEETHGFCCVEISLSYGGGGAQSYGGYILAEGHIEDLMSTFGVEYFSKLSGTPCRVYFKDNNARYFDKVVDGVGHITENKWFSFRDYTKEAKGRCGRGDGMGGRGNAGDGGNTGGSVGVVGGTTGSNGGVGGRGGGL